MCPSGKKQMSSLNESLLNTPDLNTERLAKLKELFPDLFTVEGRLDGEELKKLVDLEYSTEKERYEFRWFGKSQAKRNAFTPTNKRLFLTRLAASIPVKAKT